MTAGVTASVALLAATTLVGCSTDDSENSSCIRVRDPRYDFPQESRQPPPSASSAASGGEVKIAESGFSFIGSAIGSETSWYEKSLSVGLVVENTSSESAYDATIQIDAYNAAGKTVESQKNSYIIPLLGPGERTSIGSFVPVSQPDNRDDDRTTTRLNVKVQSVYWLPAKDLPTVEAKIDHADPKAKGPMTVTTTQNDYCGPLKFEGISMVFRNKAGQIVGGGLDSHTMRSRSQREKLCAQGTNTAENVTIVPTGPIATKFASTDYSVHCDPAFHSSVYDEPSMTIE